MCILKLTYRNHNFLTLDMNMSNCLKEAQLVRKERFQFDLYYHQILGCLPSIYKVSLALIPHLWFFHTNSIFGKQFHIQGISFYLHNSSKDPNQREKFFCIPEMKIKKVHFKYHYTSNFKILCKAKNDFASSLASLVSMYQTKSSLDFFTVMY